MIAYKISQYLDAFLITGIEDDDMFSNKTRKIIKRLHKEDKSIHFILFIPSKGMVPTSIHILYYLNDIPKENFFPIETGSNLLISLMAR
jgi:hypothetical protein